MWCDPTSRPSLVPTDFRPGRFQNDDFRYISAGISAVAPTRQQYLRKNPGGYGGLGGCGVTWNPKSPKKPSERWSRRHNA
jgi:hypothetical protein